MEQNIQAAIAVGSHREALTLIAQTHSRALLRLCYGMVGDAAEAEELLQDTLTQAYQALPRYRDDGSVRSWLFGIARKVCASHLRRRDRRAGLWGRFIAQPPPRPSLPLDEAERNEKRRRLMEALSTLKPQHREAVLLRYQVGLDGSEMAQTLGVRPATARKRLSLGLAELRKTLAPLLADAALESESTPDEDTTNGPNSLRAG